MFTKEHIQKILKVNGLSLSSSDEEIKEVLGYAKGQDVKEALTLLRNEQDTHNSNEKPDFQDNLLEVEGRLNPHSIKKLLGIDLEVDYADIEHARQSRKSISLLQMFGIALCSLVLAITAGVVILKFYHINLFSAFF